MLFTVNEIEALFATSKLVVPCLPDFNQPVEPVCFEPLQVPLLQPRLQTPDDIRARGRAKAATFRVKQNMRLAELKLLLYGDANAVVPFDIEHMKVSTELSRRERNIISSALCRKRAKLLIAFLEHELIQRRKQSVLREP